MMLLSLRHVTKTYPRAETAVLRHVSLDLDAGEMLALPLGLEMTGYDN
ncbi:hypothetical protein [Paragemmobacter aquarius]|nr:hypothetical protein [Gemmobacter aquarius]